MNGVSSEDQRHELALVLLGIIIGGGESASRVLRSLSRHAYTGLSCDGVPQGIKSGEDQQQVTAWLRRYGLNVSHDLVEVLLEEVNERGRARKRRELMAAHGAMGLIESKGGYTRSWSSQLQRLLKEVDDEAQEQAHDEHGSDGEVRAHEYGVHDSVAW